MGRWYYNKKATVEASCDLTIFQLKKRGMLKGGRTATTVTWVTQNTGKESRIALEVNMISRPYARFKYSLTDREGNSTPYDFEVSLITTPCNFGGVRYWFACPMCGRRVGGLYLAPGDRHFICRHCNNLTYHSRNRSGMGLFGHTSRQIDKLRSEIKRWTWRGRPTRKVRRLCALERKMGVFGVQAVTRLERFAARLSRN
jgi:hypothetical protein